MKIISIANTKGGVGKSTIIHNLAVAEARKGYRTLLIDFDHQASLNRFLSSNTLESNLSDLLKSPTPLEVGQVNKTHQNNLYFLGNDKDIDASYFEQFSQLSRVNRLKLLLKDSQDFDLVFIDTPGTDSYQLYNALIASDYVLVPTLMSTASLDTFDTVFDTIRDVVQEGHNPDLKILGIIKNGVNQSHRTMNELVERKLRHFYPDLVLDSEIRTNTHYNKIQELGKDCYALTELKSAYDFNNLSHEINQKLKI